MRHLAIIAGLLILTGADKPPAVNAPPPAAPEPPANVIDHPSVWQQIQAPLNRATGRIIDEPTYELYRIQQSQNEQLGRIPAQTEAQRLREERERQLRIEQSVKQQKQSSANQPQTVKQSNLGLSVTRLEPSPIAAQATADELALARLRNARDKQLTALNQQRLADLKNRAGEQSQINAEYQKQVDQIERQYESQRDAILGYIAAPTTRP